MVHLKGRSRIRCLALALILAIGPVAVGPAAAFGQAPADPAPGAPPPPAPENGAPPPAASPPLFGLDLFQQGLPAPAQALERAVSTKSYRLGPGDQMTVNIWRAGKLPNTLPVVVSPEGKVFLPAVGDIAASGLTMEEFTQQLEGMVAQRLPGFSVSVLLTGLRAIRILVTGEVKRPGYVPATAVSRLSEVVAAAGLNEIGSMRRIQIRTGPRTRVVDFYQFLLRGALSDNPLITDGQTVVVPRRYGTVAITGAVARPGLYEIRQGENVADLLFFAGGVGVDAFTERAELFRISGQSNGPEQQEVIPINLAGARAPGETMTVLLRPGDRLHIYALSHFRGGQVAIAGAVRQPGAYELVAGMRLRDLLFRSGGLLPDADLERAQLDRIVAGRRSVVPLDLAALILAGDETQNIALQFGDEILVPSMLALAKVVFIEGRVRKPGGYAWRERETVSTLLARAEGAILDEGAPDPQAVGAAPADLTAAYIERRMPDGTRARLPVDLHRLLVQRDMAADAPLQPGDVLVVPARLRQVYVQGFVARPGAFPFEPNRTVRHYLGLATPRENANLDKVVVRRANGALTGGLDTMVEAGDTILVPEREINALMGFLGLISPLLRLINGR